MILPFTLKSHCYTEENDSDSFQEKSPYSNQLMASPFQSYKLIASQSMLMTLTFLFLHPHLQWNIANLLTKLRRH